jgi:type II restriction/modification system DNA methylase subunit YeeA
MPLSWYEFVNKWSASSLPEIAGYQQHFVDLCDALGEPRPADVDQTGADYTFQKHVPKTLGGKGFADVFKRGHFIWEYKGDRKSLTGAYEQVLQYKEALDNPPLLVVSDFKRFEVHTQWTNERKRVYKFELQDLLYHKPTESCPLPPTEVLAALFRDPETIRPGKMAERVTEDAAKLFAKLAERIELQGPHRLTAEGKEEVARFLMRLLFCFFADSVGLLPDKIFRKAVRRVADEVPSKRPALMARILAGLFAAMSHPGGLFGFDPIRYFNGGLFEDDRVIDLAPDDIGILKSLCDLDWSAVSPAVFGTLFERSLVKEKRKLIGAHYTGEADIRLVVDPVIVEPLRRRWNAVKGELDSLAQQLEAGNGNGKANGNARALRLRMEEKLIAWTEELAAVRVLDPACGSGNFLYVALRSLLDLWIEAREFARERGMPVFLQEKVSPRQLYGIEKDFFAHELASAVVWIGYLQWRFEHSMGEPKEPVLEKLDNIRLGDAVMVYDAEGKPCEPEWPEADFIVSNPPFLGGKMLRREMGDTYIDNLFRLYEGRVQAESDFVVYWFEKARAEIESGRAKRAGLLATQAIRGGANRTVLERIGESARIFMAWRDRKWELEGAAVRISIVGFESPEEVVDGPLLLDGEPVAVIHPDLTSGTNTTVAAILPENAGICFMGTTKVGAFDLEPEVARKMLAAPLNPNGRPNSDVVRPWVNALDITRRPRGMFIIDFGTEMSEEEAALYEMPFEYLRKHVRPLRRKNKRAGYKEKWWLHGEPRPDMRVALGGVEKYIITPSVSKHRLFAWLPTEVLPDHAAFIFARDDDYFFGVLHSRLHEVWARQMGTQLREFESGFRYTPTSTFETFPFPWPPGKEPKRDPRVKAIAAAAKELVEKRDHWLNPEDISPEDLAKRTLTNLYNERPAWLDHAHARLDAAVFAAYGWPAALTNEEILEKLLVLNRDRSGAETAP